ncbi:MAG: DinB family protein, partial [Flavobacteriia bacterium]
LLVKEFEERVFNESYERIYKCLSMIDEKDLWRSPNEGIPTIGNMILHLCGNARQWILSGIGGRPDNRDRDQEFIIQSKIKKSELVFLLENLKVNLKQTIREMDPKTIDKKYLIQGFDVTGFSVLVHVIEHFSYHTGQITTLTKWLTNKQTDYYGNIDLNQLNKLN